VKINLWDVYKQFYQRSWRAHNADDFKNEMTGIAHDIATNKLNAQEILIRAYKLYELEKEISPNVYFSKKIINAVENNNYEIVIPNEVIHKYVYKDTIGYIYIFTSPVKNNQCKIGATASMMPSIRAIKFSSKYMYKVDVFYYKEVKDPFGFEDKIKKLIINKRVHGNLEDDSIEWYFLDPEDLKEIIEENIGK